MKLNWGTSIAIIYGLFAITMVGFVIKSKSIDHTLVVDDYYAKDLAYQQQYDKLTNSQALANDLKISKMTDGVQLLFPTDIQQSSGEILFYRADDKSKDFSLKIAPDAQGQQLVPTDQLTPGRWTVKVDWQAGGKPFYKEQVVIL
ncbi:MAG: FixH family protein [Saprospiraceae bacterium]|nr:FixH family protein [Saprospiraceae bacterium]